MTYLIGSSAFIDDRSYRLSEFNLRTGCCACCMNWCSRAPAPSPSENWPSSSESPEMEDDVSNSSSSSSSRYTARPVAPLNPPMLQQLQRFLEAKKTAGENKVCAVDGYILPQLLFACSLSRPAAARGRGVVFIQPQPGWDNAWSLLPSSNTAECALTSIMRAICIGDITISLCLYSTWLIVRVFF